MKVGHQLHDPAALLRMKKSRVLTFCRKEEFLEFAGTEPRFFCHPSPSLVTISTPLSQLINLFFFYIERSKNIQSSLKLNISQELFLYLIVFICALWFKEVHCFSFRNDWTHVKVKVKVKLALVQVVKPQRGSRTISLLFINFGDGWGWVATPRPGCLMSRKETVTHYKGGWGASRPVWTGAENLSPTGIRTPDRPARSESLYRLRYPGPLWKHVHNQNTKNLRRTCLEQQVNRRGALCLWEKIKSNDWTTTTCWMCSVFVGNISTHFEFEEQHFG